MCGGTMRLKRTEQSVHGARQSAPPAKTPPSGSAPSATTSKRPKKIAGSDDRLLGEQKGAAFSARRW